MLQSTIWNKVLYETKYYMLQSTKCYTVLNITKYYMCIQFNSMFLHGNSLWITCVIFSSKKVEALRLCSTSRNFVLNDGTLSHNLSLSLKIWRQHWVNVISFFIIFFFVSWIIRRSYDKCKPFNFGRFKASYEKKFKEKRFVGWPLNSQDPGN